MLSLLHKMLFLYSGGDGAPVLTFEEQMLALPGIHTWWKLDEASGTVAENSISSGVRQATYVASPSLASESFPAGGSSVVIADANDDIDAASLAEMNAAWGFDTGWLSFWYKKGVTSSHDLLLRVQYDTNRIDAEVPDPSANYGAYIRHSTPSSNVSYWCRHTDWVNVSYTWDSNNEFRGYFQGALFYQGSLGTLDATEITSFTLGRTSGYRGALGHVSFGAGLIPSSADFDNIYKFAYPETERTLAVIGDSWATNNDYWIDTLVAGLRGVDNTYAWHESTRLGILNPDGYSGQRIATIATNAAADLVTYAPVKPHAWIIAGNSNDVTGTPTDETTYKAALTSLAATLYAYSPVPVFIQDPGRDDADYTTEEDNVASWNAELVSSIAYLYQGVDNQATFKVNAATWSTDDLHPDTETGRQGVSDAWLAVLQAAGLT